MTTNEIEVQIMDGPHKGEIHKAKRGQEFIKLIDPRDPDEIVVTARDIGKMEDISLTCSIYRLTPQHNWESFYWYGHRVE